MKNILKLLENSGLKSSFLLSLIFQFYLMKPAHFLSALMALVSIFFPMFIVLIGMYNFGARLRLACNCARAISRRMPRSRALRAKRVLIEIAGPLLPSHVLHHFLESWSNEKWECAGAQSSIELGF